MMGAPGCLVEMSVFDNSMLDVIVTAEVLLVRLTLPVFVRIFRASSVPESGCPADTAPFVARAFFRFDDWQVGPSLTQPTNPTP
jgi:hypothetical protein